MFEASCRRGVDRGYGRDDRIARSGVRRGRSVMDFAALVVKLKSEADALIAQYPESRSALLPILHRFQQEQGYVSPEAILQTAEWLKMTPAAVESTVTFYSLFYRR